ncbi:hypothetical protein DSO57_1002056 [Entomophthora muscae]|uniref:Uncharacterized protein n=1 Tax=Entomophthora muscae TaxID=34485 RepID=A0ACC2SAX1_9FUNG|nr:hypothetical protein DSO57_1002056 [Entomophthora muscae]
MHSSIYKYYLNSGDHIECFMCQYSYRSTAPISTLQKHLRAKHGYSIKCPPPKNVYESAIFKAKIVYSYKYINLYAPPLPPSRRITIEELLN